MWRVVENFLPLYFMHMNPAASCVQWLWKKLVLWWEDSEGSAQHLQWQVFLFENSNIHCVQLDAFNSVLNKLMVFSKNPSRSCVVCLSLWLSVCQPCFFFFFFPLQLLRVWKPVRLSLTDWLHNFCQSDLWRHRLGSLLCFSLPQQWAEVTWSWLLCSASEQT